MWEDCQVLRSTPSRSVPGLATVVALAVVVGVALPSGDVGRPVSTATAGAAGATTLGATTVGAMTIGAMSATPRPDGQPKATSASLPTSLHVVVGMAADVATGGYWLVASDGGVFTFNAPFFGSAGAVPLVRPIVGMAATPDGGGYWLVASDGGVFSYGDARFLGSMGGRPLDRPMVGMAATPDGGGYWLVASDGGVFAFGDAPFLGSTGGVTLNRPVVGMAATGDGAGYWLVASDGGVFCFGAPFFGSATGHLVRAAVGVAASTGPGYRVVSVDGGVFTFGGAPFYGSAYVPPMVGETVAIDPGHNGGNGGAAGFISQPIDGGNITEPCDTVGTETAGGYPEHAFNFDVGVRLAALLQSEGATVVMTRATDTGVGPCVNGRAAIANAASANAAISIHADGGPVSGRGFDVVDPAPVVSPISNNTAIVPTSAQLAAAVRDQFANDTGEPPSDYSGANGIQQRGDLGGLNLSTVPKVLIECANMQNPTDAALTESPQFRQQAAQGLVDGITRYLVTQEIP
jgi:N-acetylmuramoyl-L-alanine amidase